MLSKRKLYLKNLLIVAKARFLWFNCSSSLVYHTKTSFFFLRKLSLVPIGTNATIILPEAAFKSSYCKSSVTSVERAKVVQVYFCKHRLN